MGDELLDVERTSERDEVADFLVGLASALDAGRPATIETDEGVAVVDVPPALSFEIELEREDDDGGAKATLELEFEWALDEGREVRVDEPPSSADARRGDEPSWPPIVSMGTPSDAQAGGPSGQRAAGRPPESAAEHHPDHGATEDVAERRPRRSHFEVYRDRSSEWRWRLVHWNGNVIADSGQGYATRRNAEKGLRSVIRNAPVARVEHLG